MSSLKGRSQSKCRETRREADVLTGSPLVFKAHPGDRDGPTPALLVNNPTDLSLYLLWRCYIATRGVECLLRASGDAIKTGPFYANPGVTVNIYHTNVHRGDTGTGCSSKSGRRIPRGGYCLLVLLCENLLSPYSTRACSSSRLRSFRVLTRQSRDPRNRKIPSVLLLLPVLILNTGIS